MIYVLVLNDMRSSQIEIPAEVMRSTDRQRLVDLLESERVENYQDGPWHKVFRCGGPLEWFNPPSATGEDGVDVFGFGVQEWVDVDTYLQRMREKYEERLADIPELV